MFISKPNEPDYDVPSQMADTRERPLAMVLVADDDEVNRQIVQHILTESRGYGLTMAEDGRAALKACLTTRFDLLIVDYKMPGISGDRLIRHLRSSANPNSSTPMVLFSAATRQELGTIVTGCRADDVIGKPINTKEFLSSVRKLLAENCVS